MPHLKTTRRSNTDMTRKWRADGRPTPVSVRLLTRQAKSQFRQTTGASAAYRGWTTRPTADTAVHQYVCVQVERPGSALFHPWQRLRGYGRLTLFGVTTVGVRVKRPGRNQLVDLAA